MRSKSIILLCSFWSICTTTYSQNTINIQVKKFQLSNGLTVYMNEDTTATNVFGAVLVNSGSVHESPEATGMSHYLEHLLFKGTDLIGSLDFEKEKIHYDSIIELYDHLENAKSKNERVKIQKKINEQSIEASKYGLPNEFSDLLKSIGGSEISAFADYDITFYHNYFPSNQMEKWLDLYANRFVNPVFRSFQSELEVVYEEKNRWDDDFENAIYTEMQALLYPNYAYGLWNPLGKTEHLKNPSLSKMHKFYKEHYVAKNMALILTGNFNSKTTRPIIEEKFKLLDASLFDSKSFPFPESLIEKRMREISVTPFPVEGMAFHTVIKSHPDRVALDVCEYLLANELETGILNQLQLDNKIKTIYAESDVHRFATSYSIFFVPSNNSSFEESEVLIKEGLSKLKSGQFSIEQLKSAQLNLSKNFEIQLENLEQRSLMIAEAHSLGMSWSDYANNAQRISTISIEEVTQVAKKYFTDKYVVLKSKKGSPKKDELKKPTLIPVTANDTSESIYAINLRKLPSTKSAPKFIKNQDALVFDLSGGHQVYLIQNPINNLFQLEIILPSDSKKYSGLSDAISIMKYAGVGEWSSIELKSNFEALGCTYSFEFKDDLVAMKIEGLEANLEACLKLTGSMLANPLVDQAAKKSLINDYQTKRGTELNSPFTLGYALIRYGVFGNQSQFLRRTSMNAIKQKDPEKILEPFVSMFESSQADLIYVGKKNQEQLTLLFEKYLNLAQPMIVSSTNTKPIRAVNENIIYLISDNKVRQSQVYFYLPGDKYEPTDYPLAKAFNTYYGESLTGVIYQEIREYRSLAYSTFARYIIPDFPDEQGYLVTGFGCQSDKTMEAIEVMTNLMAKFPNRSGRMENLKLGMIKKIDTESPNFRIIGSKLAKLRRRRIQEDPNIQAYPVYQKLKLEQLEGFYNDQFSEKPYLMTIYGNKKDLNLKQLQTYGEIVELDIKDILSY